MNAAELLTIDVEAELRRVAEAGLEGPWQVPTELVRRAAAAGATRIDVELHRRRVVVRDDGRPLAADHERALQRLLDAQLPPAERHAALVVLEAEAELIAIAALRPSRVEASSTRAGGTTLTIDTAGFDVAAARRWLRSCARFGGIAVVVDGERVTDGFASALGERPLPAPLDGRLALTHEPAAHLWLLAHGVVSSHLTLPDTPAFEAAIEMSSMVEAASPAALREAIEPHLAALVDAAVAFILESTVAEELSDSVLRELRGRVLVAVRRGYRREEALHAPVLPVVVGPDGTLRGCLCLADLGEARALPCLGPHDDPTAHLLPYGSVLVLDDDERGQIAQLLDVRFRSVPRRRVRAGLFARLRGWTSSAMSALRGFGLRLRHPGSGRVLAESAHTSDERAFLRAARAARPAGVGGISFTDGAAPSHLADGHLHLPRRHADVMAAVRAFARDPAYLYVALLALVPSGRAPAEETALGWRRLFG